MFVIFWSVNNFQISCVVQAVYICEKKVKRPEYFPTTMITNAFIWMSLSLAVYGYNADIVITTEKSYTFCTEFISLSLQHGLRRLINVIITISMCRNLEIFIPLFL